MSTFVLVHGAHHGTWCWDLVVSVLERSGHIVHAPCLTGLGERAKELTRHVDLSTHVRDVEAAVAGCTEPVVLVGHSYGTLPVAGAAATCGDRVAHVVLVDGPVPEDGERAVDVLPGGAALPRRTIELDGVRVTPVPDAAKLGISDPVLRARAQELMTPQPHRCAVTPVVLGPAWDEVPKTYILCDAGPRSSERPYLARVTPGRVFGPLVRVEAGHDVMLDRPSELVRLLERVAASVT